MTWSYRIATIRNIPVHVHVTFVLLVLLVAAHWSALGPVGMVFGVGMALLLFGCVTLHELGHAVAAQHFGIPVRRIVLLPFGGVALLGREPRNALQELLIAAAGPAMNVLVVAALLPALWLLGEPLSIGPALLGPSDATTISVGEAVRWLVGANLSLVVFNLIPAFPLDGGRILRGLLGLATDWSTATRLATGVGQALAVGMGVYGVTTGRVSLAIVAVLIFLAASATNAEEQGRTVLASQRVGDACNRHAIVLDEREGLGDVVRYLLTTYQPDFAVMCGAELLGVVQRTQVLTALMHGRGDVPVTAVMGTCQRLRADDSLAHVRTVLVESGARVAAVYDGERYLGLVSLDDISEAEMVLAAVQRTAGRRPWPPEARVATPAMQER